MVLSWWKTTPFQMANSRWFSSIATYICPMETVLVWIQNLILQKELVIHSAPSNPTRYTASSSLDAYWLSIYPRALFTPHCCKQFFIDCDCSFKKWVILVVFEQRIADRNVVHQPLNCDSSKHHSNSHIQVFSKTIKCSYEIWGLSLRCLNLCGLDCF